MGSNQRETVFFVQFGNIIYQPGLWGMTTYTIDADRLAVHIGMARNTIRRRYLIKDQSSVTKFAIYLGVSTVQWIIGLIMIKLKCVRIYSPP